MHEIFVRPWVLTLSLGLLPVIVALVYFGFRNSLRSRDRYATRKNLERYSLPFNIKTEKLRAVGWASMTVLLLLALAGPQMSDAPASVQKGAVRVVAVSDVSLSMATVCYAGQMPPKNGLPASQIAGYGSTLDMAKLIVTHDIEPAITGSLLGVATYRGEGWDQADLTDDFDTLQYVLDHWVVIGNAPGGGSDTSEGLRMALKIFDNNHAKGKDTDDAIVLFSDGGYTGDPAALTKVLGEIRDRHIRLIIVGIGCDTPVGVPDTTTYGQEMTGYIKVNGVTVETQIDEEALKAMATEGGGEYMRVAPGHNLNVSWASKLAGDSKVVKHMTTLYQIPLGLAMVLFFVLVYRRRKQ